MNLPNQLTMLRLLLTPVIIWFIYLDGLLWKVMALVLFVLAMLTDVIDGVIAKKRNLSTAFGTFLDPVVDKILILSMFFVFVDMGLLPLWLVLILLARELIVTGVRTAGTLQGKLVGANWMGKTKASLQTGIIILTLALLTAQKIPALENFAGQWTVPVVYGLTALMVALAVIFMIIFFYWNRDIVFKAI